MIRFGPWSTTLGLAAGFGALVALLLLRAGGNRPAQRLLAALLGVAVLRLMPYVLGFAGFYDVYPWLSFAPFDLALATGPLLYLYLTRLSAPRLPSGWRWHFLPAALALAYTLWAFQLTLADKLRWNDSVHEPWISPLLDAAALLSLAVYLWLSFQLRRRYLRWLREHVSDQDAWRQPWIASVLAALGLWLAVAAGFELADRLVRKLSYYDRFGEYLAFSAIILWLGLEGWRHAGRAFPLMTPPASQPPAAPGRDWDASATLWLERIRQEGWWRQPGLTLAEVAARLGTNESYVSRAFNQGLGRNFNAAINAMRVEAVQSAMLAGDQRDLLSLALDCGFSSKSSFNRVFSEQAGLSPSAWRKAQIVKNTANPASGTTPAGGRT